MIVLLFDRVVRMKLEEKDSDIWRVSFAWLNEFDYAYHLDMNELE